MHYLNFLEPPPPPAPLINPYRQYLSLTLTLALVPVAMAALMLFTFTLCSLVRLGKSEVDGIGFMVVTDIFPLFCLGFHLYNH